MDVCNLIPSGDIDHDQSEEIDHDRSQEIDPDQSEDRDNSEESGIIYTDKVLIQGKLISVKYTLRTYWNQFSLAGNCKQE